MASSRTRATGAALAVTLAAATLSLAAAPAHAAATADWYKTRSAYSDTAVHDQVAGDHGVWAVGPATLDNDPTYTGINVHRVEVTRVPVDFGDPVATLAAADIAQDTRVNIEAAGDGFLLAIDRGATHELRTYTATGAPTGTHTIATGTGTENAVHTASGPAGSDAVAVAVASPTSGTVTVHTSTDAGATWATSSHPTPGYSAHNTRIVSYDGTTTTLSWRADDGTVHLDVITGNPTSPTVARHVLPGGLHTSPAVVRTRSDGVRVLNWYTHTSGSPDQTLFEDPLDTTWSTTATNPAADAATTTIPGTLTDPRPLRGLAVSDTMVALSPSSDPTTNVFARTGATLTPQHVSSHGGGAPAPTDWAGPVGLDSPDHARAAGMWGNEASVFYPAAALPGIYANPDEGLEAYDEQGTLAVVALYGSENRTCTLTGNGATLTPETDPRLTWGAGGQRGLAYHDYHSCEVFKDTLEPGTWTLTLTGQAVIAAPGTAPATGTATTSFTVTAPEDPTDPDPEDPTDPDPEDPTDPGEPELTTRLRGPELHVLTGTRHRFTAIATKADVTYQWQKARLRPDGRIVAATTTELTEHTGPVLPLRLRRGDAACVRVRGHRDAYGISSDWTGWKCATAPIDDRQFTRDGRGVSHTKHPRAYRNTLTVIRRAGTGIRGGPATAGANRATVTFRKSSRRARVVLAVDNRAVEVLYIPAGTGTLTRTVDLGRHDGRLRIVRLTCSAPVKFDAITFWHTR